MMTKTQAATEVASHVVATLPDSISSRRNLLDATLIILPRDVPCADQLLLLREHLARHESLRAPATLSGGES